MEKLEQEDKNTTIKDQEKSVAAEKDQNIVEEDEEEKTTWTCHYCDNNI